MLNYVLFLFFQRLQILIPILIIIPSSLSRAQLLPIHAIEGKHDTYIVEVESHGRHMLLSDEELESFHSSFLPNSTLDSGEPRLVYSYRHVLSGFAARHTPAELDAVKSKSGFLHTERDRTDKPTTTYTPRYLGVSNSSGWGGTMMGNGLINGILDTGIKSTHPSFDDAGMPPPLTKWKGNCSYTGFRCNDKIIGAMAFRGVSHPLPEDEDRHETHVAGIAGGNFVKGANVLGIAGGLVLNDYVGYLCGLGYADWEVRRTIGRNLTCVGVTKLSASELNYPSISVNLTQGMMRQKVNRTATNVAGNMREDYIANITEPTGVTMYLSTDKLQFTRDREKKSYEITFDATAYPKPRSNTIRRGKIVWSSSKHVVTSPIAIRFT